MSRLLAIAAGVLVAACSGTESLATSVADASTRGGVLGFAQGTEKPGPVPVGVNFADAPVITGLGTPHRELAKPDPLRLLVDYRDSQGDVRWIYFGIVGESSHYQLQSDVMPGQTEGTIELNLYPLAYVPGWYTLAVSLEDAQGNVSNRDTLDFVILWPNGALPDGGPDTPFDASPTDGTSDALDQDTADEGTLQDALHDANEGTSPDVLDDAAPDSEVCEYDPCRLTAPQCGCPPTDMCTTPFGSGTIGCAPAGTVPLFSPCTDHTDCAPGLACPGFGSPEDLCRPWCYTQSDCDGPSTCVESAAGYKGYGACTDSCDPLADVGCPGGMTCYFLAGKALESDWVGVFVCSDPGATLPGADCEVSMECVPGYTCIIGHGCSELCDLDNPECLSGKCTALTLPTEGSVRYGACV